MESRRLRKTQRRLFIFEMALVWSRALISLAGLGASADIGGPFWQSREVSTR